MHRNPPLQDLSIYHRRGHGNHHSISYSQGLAILIGTYNHLPLHSILRFGHILCSVLWLVHGTVSSVYRSYPSISNRIHLSNPGSIRIPPGRCSQSLKHIHRNLHLTDHDILYIFHHTYRGTLYTHYHCCSVLHSTTTAPATLQYLDCGGLKVENPVILVI